MNMPDSEHRVHLVLVNVRSALNVGSMMRTADALGIEKVWLAGYTPSADHLSVKKTALGAEKTVPWEHIVDPIACLDRLKEEGFRRYALECGVDGAEPLGKTKVANPCAIVVGNEVEGLSKMQIARCDGILEIPMAGMKESLNVAVAAGIALWEVVSRES
jgi:23S rRNA (guanosine2251-2'-O)-methyltransferase